MATSKMTKRAAPKTARRATSKAIVAKPPRQLAEFRTRSKAVLKSLEQVQASGGSEMPPAASEAFSRLSGMTSELIAARQSAFTAYQASQPTTRPKNCSKYNTYWNAFKSLLGVCDEWTECMYGCD